MTMTPKDQFGFRFRDWDIYKDSRSFRIEINILLKNYPSEEKYALVDQSKRALNSIVLNIAEGANKNTDKDTKLYINRAHCSLDEVTACLDCALDDKYITEAEHQIALEKASSLAKRLRAFSAHLNEAVLSSSIANGHSRSYGFTLIEMLVVIFILALISSVSIANYRKAERQKRVAIAADIVTNAIRNAQNFSLTSRQLAASSCVQGKSPKSYIIFFSFSQTLELYGVDKCDASFLIESYVYPTSTRIQSSGYKLNGSSVASLQAKFTPPFAKLTASSGSNINTGTFNTFTTATVTVEATDGSFSKIVTVDGVSGRIGE